MMQTAPRLPMTLSNTPDEYQAAGPFDIRPTWPGKSCDDDDWEVARPTTPRGRETGIVPIEVCICPNRQTAHVVCYALNTTYPIHS